jgi:hypothetical protein
MVMIVRKAVLQYVDGLEDNVVETIIAKTILPFPCHLRTFNIQKE